VWFGKATRNTAAAARCPHTSGARVRETHGLASAVADKLHERWRSNADCASPPVQDPPTVFKRSTNEMNAKRLPYTPYDWRAALMTLATVSLMGAGPATAQTTKPTDAQTRPDSPSQVKPGTTTGQSTSTFTPKPNNQSAPPGPNNQKTEK